MRIVFRIVDGEDIDLIDLEEYDVYPSFALIRYPIITILCRNYGMGPRDSAIIVLQFI